jgi:hypothetical protein|tara:strand:+ start:706 stop:1368 length:663 start_codon:yes stop_codon:yes gene_type:complete
MIQLFLLINYLSGVCGDIVEEYYQPHATPDNYVPIDNMVATIWAGAICSCVGLVCSHKNKTIKVVPCEDYDHNYEKKSYYKIEIINKDEIYKLKKDLDEMKKAIISHEKISLIAEKEKFIAENNISMEIPENIKYKFGKAPISFKQNGKYYHGVDPDFNASWNPSNYISCLWHYTNPATKLPHPRWDTHEIEGFCLDCSYCSDKNRKKRANFIYKCNGHE